MKVAVIGTGQQGGSKARALDSHADYNVFGYDINPEALNKLSQQSHTENVMLCQNSQEAVQDADIVMLDVPIDQFQSVIKEIAPYLKPGVIITDNGSGKEKAIGDIQAILAELEADGTLNPGDVRFVGGHGLNGKAKPGPENSDPNMYQDVPIVLVPDGTDPEALDVVKKLWRDMGGVIVEMKAQTHDKLYGTISHFEHVAFFALTKMLADPNDPFRASADLKEGGKSLLAGTRIAAGSPEMWVPLLIDNGPAIRAAAQGFKSELSALKTAVRFDNKTALTDRFREAHEYRVAIPDDPRETVRGEVADSGYETPEYFQFDEIHPPFDSGLGCNAAPYRDYEAESTKLARRITLPSLIGAAITRNAMQVEKSLGGVSLKDNANPSFKDGSAPMLTNPNYLADLMLEYGNGRALLTALESYEAELDTLVGHIENEDKDQLRAYIEQVNAIRADNVPAKADPTTVRPQYEAPRAVA